RGEQRPIQVELAYQIGLRQGLAGHGQQRERQQIDRRHGRGRVDVAHYALGQLIHRRPQPAGPGLIVKVTRTPGALVAIEDVGERNRLAEVDVDLAEALPQHPPGAKESADALLLLRTPGELADVSGALDEALVAEVDGHEHHRAHGIGEEAAHGHQQHASLWLQQTPGAAAAALDEVLDRVPPAHDRGQVFHEDDRIQLVAGEATANEEGTALAQETADHRQIEVDAG